MIHYSRKEKNKYKKSKRRRKLSEKRSGNLKWRSWL